MTHNLKPRLEGVIRLLQTRGNTPARDWIFNGFLSDEKAIHQKCKATLDGIESANIAIHEVSIVDENSFFMRD